MDKISIVEVKNIINGEPFDIFAHPVELDLVYLVNILGKYKVYAPFELCFDIKSYLCDKTKSINKIGLLEVIVVPNDCREE